MDNISSKQTEIKFYKVFNRNKCYIHAFIYATLLYGFSKNKFEHFQIQIFTGSLSLLIKISWWRRNSISIKLSKSTPVRCKANKKKRNNCSICMTTINPHGKLYTLILYVNVRLLTRLTLFKCQKCGYWRLRSLRVILTTRLTILYLRIKRYSCVKGLLIFFSVILSFVSFIVQYSTIILVKHTQFDFILQPLYLFQELI